MQAFRYEIANAFDFVNDPAIQRRQDELSTGGPMCGIVTTDGLLQYSALNRYELMIEALQHWSERREILTTGKQYLLACRGRARRSREEGRQTVFRGGLLPRFIEH